jgi:DNA-binding Lrp family transcriptional regulator
VTVLRVVIVRANRELFYRELRKCVGIGVETELRIVRATVDEKLIEGYQAAVDLELRRDRPIRERLRRKYV